MNQIDISQERYLVSFWETCEHLFKLQVMLQVYCYIRVIRNAQFLNFNKIKCDSKRDLKRQQTKAHLWLGK